MVWGFSFAAILAQCMASRVELWSFGWAMPIPVHLEDFVCPMEPNIMSLMWGELYCVIWVGHVRGDE